MKTTIAFAFAILVASSSVCFGMGTGGSSGISNGNNNGYNNWQHPDNKDTLNWPTIKFEDAKAKDKPVLLLVKDENDHQHRALPDIEKLFDDAGVKEKKSEFTLVEITHGASSGWKEALGQLPVGDTRLMVIGWSYEKRPVVIDTLGQDKLRTTPVTLVNDIALVEKLIQKNKDDAAKEAKERENEKVANGVKK
jgi:hypothetical protein